MNPAQERQVVVAGHICVDIIPAFEQQGDKSVASLVPGTLIHIGPAVIATGGAASNTGMALHRLGVPTRIIGKISDDLFGNAILNVLRERDPALTQDMVFTDSAPSSYTIVISPPGVDRSFLHCPGANDTFGPEDIDLANIANVSLFHFGYPPLMRRMYCDGGYELTELLGKVHNAGIVTSLDLAHIDPLSEAGRIDWPNLLRMALAQVDLFVPSLDEVFPILEPERFKKAAALPGGFMKDVDAELLHSLSSQLIQMGASIVCLKMGEYGVYLRTSADRKRLGQMQSLHLAENWLGRELLAPAYAVDVVGTTGAGDCAIAGFLAGILRDLSPEESLSSAVAAGGANVERADALSGVPTWDDLQRRMRDDWAKSSVALNLPNWRYDHDTGVWLSPTDVSF